MLQFSILVLWCIGFTRLW